MAYEHRKQLTPSVPKPDGDNHDPSPSCAVSNWIWKEQVFVGLDFKQLRTYRG